jgi:uncharacterized membrane protein
MSRTSWLLQVLRWLVVILILRVLVTILRNYPGYFPPDFKSDFLQGREADFPGLYAFAFYTHIVSAPLVLLFGLFLLNHRARQWSPRFHRILGRIQVILILVCVVPSSLVMSRYAYAGAAAGLSFFMLSIATGVCTGIGVCYAFKRRITSHETWMTRSYLLLTSAVILRLLSGLAIVLQVEQAETAYIIAAWASWLLPLGLYETWHRLSRLQPLIPSGS